MSGASDAYALFVFPPDVPIQSYIQAIPDMVLFINNVKSASLSTSLDNGLKIFSDLLSFFKEELAGENVNHVSLIARCKGISKVAALESITKEAASSCMRIKATLESDSLVKAAFEHFSQGYITFHTKSPRYRLQELRRTVSASEIGSGMF